jgi:hypothetical protein
MTCGKCAGQPAGIEGHDDLFVLLMGGRQCRFRCQACGALWDRRYEGQSDYSWARPREGTPAGMKLPGSAARNT